jgi:hypothetical protein
MYLPHFLERLDIDWAHIFKGLKAMINNTA